MTENFNPNGRRVKDDAWLSLPMAKRAAAVGLSERTLHSYKALGCPCDDGAATINRWRAENVHRRRGGIPSRAASGASEPVGYHECLSFAVNAEGNLFGALNTLLALPLADEQRDEVATYIADLIDCLTSRRNKFLPTAGELE